MNGALFLQKRSRRHMARVMEHYEKFVEPHLKDDLARSDSDKFKGCLRDVIKELTSDGTDIIEAVQNGEEINGIAIEMRDRLGVR